ncbi:tyrosine-type recombinase/integrase [Actinomadura parmotrematis]|uniref:Tyrosine-type recombinase/integrase n=1 Tax=Actinomadura parmotrematis TaxID=2864039 RepID=A0ABS7FQI5_9ACTN|nr:tyrosine-type recombinase/integrase [Actinomadura parmotrematis]MBW8482626.1 tyrosine-type recombinase/integrase [Actinomadura parmotrematis]
MLHGAVVASASAPPAAPVPAPSALPGIGRNPAGDAFAEAVALLPALPADAPGDRYGLRTVTAAWLRSQNSEATRRAYYGDLAGWLDFCARTRLEPLAARRSDLDDWTVTMTSLIRSGGSRPASAATKARRLAAVSSWYTYLQSNEVTDRNPALLVKRPSAAEVRASARRAPTLSVTETAALLDAAERRARERDTEAAWRDAATIALLFYTALRVSAITGADIADLTVEAGYRILWYRAKGKGPDGRDYVRLDGELTRVLDLYLQVRARRSAGGACPPGPLLVTTPHPRDPSRPGGKRLTQRDVTNVLRRQAAAIGLPAADTLSPHSGRRTVITTLLGNDVPLAKVQDLAGHADPRTTRRYDDTNHKLATSPVTDLTRILARHRTQQ